jgi:hypothetical protein
MVISLSPVSNFFCHLASMVTPSTILTSWGNHTSLSKDELLGFGLCFSLFNVVSTSVEA